MPDPVKKTPTISLPTDFEFGAVPSVPVVEERPVKEGVAAPALAPVPAPAPTPPPPPLGAIAAFVGDWVGNGFNTIFRPDSLATPTPMPFPITTTDPADNVLELNITAESLSFSRSLGTVPNRGSNAQADISLNGIPYLQTISDVTANLNDPKGLNDPTKKNPGIHVEPGLWMTVPSTTAPQEPPTLVRMGSIPHGTTIQAQGTSSTAPGPPNIPPVDITPFFIAPPNTKHHFQNQDAANQGTRRIPQNFTVAPFNAKSIAQWQAMISDPNSVLRDALAGLTIKSTTTIQINTASTGATTPTFGGGTDNIAFLDGDAAVANPNAQAIQMSATFWIEEVEHTITIPIIPPGKPPVILQPKDPGPLTPTFSVPAPPKPMTQPRVITVISTQIQYSQIVLLNFSTLSWPHVSVATLKPANSIVLPASIWN